MLDSFVKFLETTGVARLFSEADWWKTAIMFGIAFVLVYLAIVKQFEPLLLLPTSLDIYSLILHRRLLNVTNVGRPLLIPHILLYILELTLERSLLSVMCVGKHLPLLHILSYTNELTLERNHMNVRNVEKPFLTSQAFLTI